MWVVDMGLEELLFMRIRNIDPKFGYWITSKLDHETLELEIRPNYKVKIDEALVTKVLGLRSGCTLKYPSHSTKSTSLQLKKMYKKNTLYGAIKESGVYGKIVVQDSSLFEFEMHFLLYTLGILLCPTQKTGWISPLHVSVIEHAHHASDYNWARYMLDWLVKYAKNLIKSKEGYGGCTLLLVVSIITLENYCL